MSDLFFYFLILLPFVIMAILAALCNAIERKYARRRRWRR